MTKLYLQALVPLFITVLFAHSGHAQFEGRVVYKLDYHSTKKDLRELSHFFPKRSELFINGKNTRYQQDVNGGAKQIYINNRVDNQKILVMNFLGESFKINLSNQEIEKLQEIPTGHITYTGLTKEILGYNCAQAIAVQGDDTLTMYVASELYEGNMLPQYEDLNGLALEYETKQDGLSIKFQATELVHEKVADDWFTISDAIQEISFEAFAKAFAYKKES